MLKYYFVEAVEKGIKEAINAGKLGNMQEFDGVLVCEKPKNPDFGDFAINVSSLAKNAKMAPPQIAKNISDFIEQNGFSVNYVAGFINFNVGEKFIKETLKEIIRKRFDYAKTENKNPKKINLEYVSANPTGPFHIGHGRWAAVGSALANILKYCGNDVFQEFYINDAGNQINKLAQSLELRVRELKGEKIEMPEDSYRGDYLIECAKRYIETENNENFGEFAKKDMLSQQKNLLEKFNTHFDLFFPETDLYKNNEVQECIEKLDKIDKLYKKDDAVWFKTTDFGDEQDRVIKKADGTNTYLTADIAYHHNKLQRGFDTLINIWGADHHGYIKRIEAAIEALGYNPKSLTVLLGQLVNIIQNGEAVRMGKRKTMVTLEDLIDEVGVDATRFWMLMRSIDTTLDFDIDLAKSNSEQNPVFYVQYAYARCCSILRKATQEQIDTLNDNKTIAPFVDKDELNYYFAKSDFESLFDVDDEKSTQSIKKLVLKLEEIKSVIQNSANFNAPYLICKYLQELASDFHHFYNFTRVLTDNKKSSLALLGVIECTKTIMALGLQLIAVSTPEKM